MTRAVTIRIRRAPGIASDGQVGVLRSFLPVDLRSARMAGASASPPMASFDHRASGFRALAPALRRVQWPTKFRLEMPPCYDSAADPSPFLLAYEEAVLEAGGDDKVLANWFPMALAAAARALLPCAA